MDLSTPFAPPRARLSPAPLKPNQQRAGRGSKQAGHKADNSNAERVENTTEKSGQPNSNNSQLGDGQPQLGQHPTGAEKCKKEAGDRLDKLGKTQEENLKQLMDKAMNFDQETRRMMQE
jgi:hypothetical protein